MENKYKFNDGDRALSLFGWGVVTVVNHDLPGHCRFKLDKDIANRNTGFMYWHIDRSTGYDKEAPWKYTSTLFTASEAKRFFNLDDPKPDGIELPIYQLPNKQIRSDGHVYMLNTKIVDNTVKKYHTQARCTCDLTALMRAGCKCGGE